MYYCNDPKFLDIQVWENSADPDQTDQGLHSLLVHLHLLETFLCCKANLLQF